MGKIKIKAKDAYNSLIQLDGDCTTTPCNIVENRIENSVKADFLKLKRMIKKQLPEFYDFLQLDFRTMHEAHTRRTNEHFILVHSAIEYFISYTPNR